MIQRVGKLIDFPIFRQVYSWDCGASALQAILAFYGIDEREEVIMNHLETNEETGTTVNSLKNVARNVYNLKCVSKTNMTIQDVKKHIDNDHPIIMLIQAWPEDPKTDLKVGWDEGHFVICIGYVRDKMIFEDPSSITRTYIEINEFLDRWRDFDIDPTTGKRKLYRRWGLVFFGESKYDRRRITKLG
jgi:ABC-type bacteriocin/lantibiotic exporter with double-glycine peptidase domain